MTIDCEISRLSIAFQSTSSLFQSVCSCSPKSAVSVSAFCSVVTISSRLALLQLRVGGGDRDLAVAPQPRDDEGDVADTCDLAHGHAEYAGIVYLEGCDVGAVRVAGFGRGQVARPHPEAAHHENGQDHPYDTQRIGHRAAQRRSVGGNSQLVERLLRRTQRRRVGRRAAQYAIISGSATGVSDSGGSSCRCRSL